MLYWWNLPRLWFFMRVKLLYKLDDIWESIPWKATQKRFKMIAMITTLKLEPKLLSSRIMELCKTFHFVQNLRRKSKNLRSKNLMKMSYRAQLFCLYFRHLLHRLKNCQIYHVLHWYASLVQFFKKFELIKPHLRSFKLSSAHL